MGSLTGDRGQAASVRADSPTGRGCKGRQLLRPFQLTRGAINPLGRWVLDQNVRVCQRLGDRLQVAEVEFLLVRRVPVDTRNAPFGQVLVCGVTFVRQGKCP